jgi:hypothetical protein
MASLKATREEIAIRRLNLERKRREIDGSTVADPFFEEETEIEFMLLTARRQLHYLAQQSIEVKDIDAGLVDFKTLINGREACLCWRVGEPEVAYWHGVNEGFANRKRLPGPDDPDSRQAP